MLIVVSNLSNITKCLEDFFIKNKIAFNNKLHLEYNEKHSFLIIEPFRVKSFYTSISQIWKFYLTYNIPDAKLVVMGFSKYQSPNYVDLLNFPVNFELFLDQALSASEDWEIPIDGANMLEYMQRFFAGHGGHSLLSKLNALRQTFNIAYSNLADGDADFKEIWGELLLPFGKPEWEELLQRWKNYYPYFEYLPFYPTMQQIDAVFSEISEFFACKFPDEALFLNQSIDVKLGSVHQQLVEIDRLYIRPEIYRETQSAPDR